jgi:hypothetical protein
MSAFRCVPIPLERLMRVSCQTVCFNKLNTTELIFVVGRVKYMEILEQFLLLLVFN